MKTLLALITALGMAVAAPPLATAAGWYSGTIGNVQVGSDGWILLFLNAPNNECGSTEVMYTKTIFGNDDAKAILAMLLSWQAEDKPMRVWINSCGGAVGSFTAVVNN